MTAATLMESHFTAEAERLHEAYPDLTDEEIHALIVEGLTHRD